MESIQHVGLIGRGAIARTVMASVDGDARVRIAGVVVRSGRSDDSGISGVPSVVDLDERITLVVEAAGAGAVAEHGVAVLRSGRDFAIASTAALVDDGLLHALQAAARETGSKLYAISGAIGGLDALGASRAAELSAVRYTGRKPPRAWLGTPAAERVDLARLKGPTTVFEGTARVAVKLYPQNANVAATIALAGLGFDRTGVTLVADPGIERNVHRVEAESNAGTIRFEVEARSIPSNPKTSAMAAYSIVNFLQTRSGAIRLDIAV